MKDPWQVRFKRSWDMAWTKRVNLIRTMTFFVEPTIFSCRCEVMSPSIMLRPALPAAFGLKQPEVSALPWACRMVPYGLFASMERRPLSSSWQAQEADCLTGKWSLAYLSRVKHKRKINQSACPNSYSAFLA